MNFLKLTLLLAIGGLTTTQAAAQEPICPTVETIRSLSIRDVEFKEGIYIAGIFNHSLNTDTTWTFQMASIHANTAEEAKSKALEALKTLTFENGPIALDLYGGWACTYRTSKGYIASAITPAFK